MTSLIHYHFDPVLLDKCSAVAICFLLLFSCMVLEHPLDMPLITKLMYSGRESGRTRGGLSPPYNGVFLESLFQRVSPLLLRCQYIFYCCLARSFSKTSLFTNHEAIVFLRLHSNYELWLQKVIPSPSAPPPPPPPPRSSALSLPLM